MWKKLTYKQRYYLLIAGLVIFFYLCYKMAIKETFIVRKECRQTEERLRQVKTAPQQILELEKKIAKIDRSIRSDSIQDSNFHEMLLARISEYCTKNNIGIVEYPPLHSFSWNEITLETNAVIVQGNFIELLKMIYFIEQKAGIGRVSGVDFYTYYERSRRRTYLRMKLYIQYILQNDE
jgi:hypothetical protein